MIKNIGLLAILSLAAATLFIFGCGSEGFGSEPLPTLASGSVPPTFVRITVTPKPTDTPTPTPTVTPTPEPEELNYGPPEFPLEIDPDVVGERPEDEVIFEGWTDFLKNTSIVREEGSDAVHFCSRGLVMNGGGRDEFIQNWRVERSPALSFLDWGTIAVKVDVVGGRWAGNEWNILTLVRRDGKIFVTNTPKPREIEIPRSDICLQSL